MLSVLVLSSTIPRQQSFCCWTFYGRRALFQLSVYIPVTSSNLLYVRDLGDVIKLGITIGNEDNGKKENDDKNRI